MYQCRFIDCDKRESPPEACMGFKMLLPHSQHTPFSLPRTCSIPSPHLFLCWAKIRGSRRKEEEEKKRGGGERRGNRITTDRARQNFVENKKTGFSQQPIKRNITVETKRMHDGKAGTRSTNGFILAASNEAALLSEVMRFVHTPQPAALGTTGSPQGTGILSRHCPCAFARKPTCSRFRTSVSSRRSGDPSRWRAGNGASVNVYMPDSAGSDLHGAPSVRRGRLPPSLLGGLCGAEGAHSGRVPCLIVTAVPRHHLVPSVISLCGVVFGFVHT